jgi:hypothetical protein
MRTSSEKHRRTRTARPTRTGSKPRRICEICSLAAADAETYQVLVITCVTHLDTEVWVDRQREGLHQKPSVESDVLEVDRVRRVCDRMDVRLGIASRNFLEDVLRVSNGDHGASGLRTGGVILTTRCESCDNFAQAHRYSLDLQDYVLCVSLVCNRSVVST